MENEFDEKVQHTGKDRNEHENKVPQSHHPSLSFPALQHESSGNKLQPSICHVNNTQGTLDVS